MLPSLFALILFSLQGPPATDDWPPKPNFDKPVDYVAWYNACITHGHKPASPDPYKGFTPDVHGKGEFYGGMPVPNEAVDKQLSDFSMRRWKESDHPELVAYIRGAREPLKIFRRASMVRDYRPTIPSGTPSLLEQTLPILSASRNATKALLAQAWMEQPGQTAMLREAHIAALRNAGQMQGIGFLISGLVGLSERTLVYDSERGAFGHGVFEPEDAADIYKELDANDPGMPDVQFHIAVDRASCFDALQVTCPKGKADRSKWKGLLDLLDADKTANADILNSLRSFDPKKAADALDDYYHELSQIVVGPPRYAKSEKVKACGERLRARGDSARLAMVFLPSFGRTVELIARTESVRRGTMLTIALIAHHHKTGHWPAALKDIDAGIVSKDMKTLVVDSVSGKPFHYEIKNGEPLLYSLGVDGKDDGGRHEPKFGEGGKGGDYVFWPYQQN